jgi:hypothetical protein
MVQKHFYSDTCTLPVAFTLTWMTINKILSLYCIKRNKVSQKLHNAPAGNCLLKYSKKMFLGAILLVEAVSSNRATLIRSFTAFSCFSKCFRHGEYRLGFVVTMRCLLHLTLSFLIINYWTFRLMFYFL